MKYFLIILGILISTFMVNAQDVSTKNTALILIDIQNFYFPGGNSELLNPEVASKHAAKILADFRNMNILVVHIRHNVESGGDIHESVKPVDGEKVISKDEVNAFNGTSLKSYLDENNIEQVVLVGMQTHMCLEGTTRAAYDLGYECIVIGDACATKDLEYEDRVIKAAEVHYSTLKTLQSYASVVSTKEFLKPQK